jgi:hypothetical protein
LGLAPVTTGYPDFSGQLRSGLLPKAVTYPGRIPHFVGPTFENPETPEEENLRIWHEEMDR